MIFLEISANIVEPVTIHQHWTN